MAQILLDEDLPPRLEVLLRGRGHGVFRVRTPPHRSRLADAPEWFFGAATHGWTVVSHDDPGIALPVEAMHDAWVIWMGPYLPHSGC